MDSINLLTMILTIVLTIMLVLLAVLGIMYMSSKMKKKQEISTEKNNTKDTKMNKKMKTYKLESVMEFMEFDTVVDNMISQKDGKRYIMVVECQGVNYDLMSEVEKNSVEEGFIQFLNTIRHPIQIYTQTRTVNLESSLQTYKARVKEIEDEFQKQQMHYNQMLRSDSYTQEQLNQELFELTKQKNLYEYGKDIIYNTEKMSLNKNVLNKKYYVVIPYYIEELGEDNHFDKAEQRNLAFSELYTRAQSIIRTLSVCGINGKVLTSNELVELLYVAYNRDEAEVFGLDKALRAGYDELYSTAPDVVDKQMRVLNKQIEEEAVQKAQQKVNEVRSEKQKKLREMEDTKEDLINELVAEIIKENGQYVGQDIAQEAIKKIEQEKLEKEGGTKEDVQEKKTKRGRKPKTVSE